MIELLHNYLCSVGTGENYLVSNGVGLFYIFPTLTVVQGSYYAGIGTSDLPASSNTGSIRGPGCSAWAGAR